MNESQPQKVLLDTDPGIDDALAILLALASPEIDLRALTVVMGNCPLDDALSNALRVLELAKADHVPVAAGAALPLVRPLVTALETHGTHGLGYAELPLPTRQPIAQHAVDRLIEEVLAAPGEVTIVAVGPLTNVALALRKAPQIASAIREIIFMGGAFRIEGNVTPLAEFNVYVDPHAAEIVFQSGVPLLIIPWDITRDVRLTPLHVERLLATGSPIAHFIAEATRFYIEFHRQFLGFEACSINDPAALALAYMPELAKSQAIYAAVETSSALTMGKTVGDFQNIWGHSPNVRVVTEFDSPRFIEHFLSRMERLIQKFA